MTLVKICGITRLEDALAAARYGADFIGLVFAESPRRIPPGRAEEIIRALPRNIATVGVFVDEDPEKVKLLACECGLDMVQLHGSETREYADNLGVPYIKAFRARDEKATEEIKAFGAETFLLDSYVPGKAGGTGVTLDLDMAAGATRLGRMILAGGLNPDNVGNAVRTVRPYGVDVSSGVEKAPGLKDHDLVRRFIAEAKSCGT